MKENDRYYKKCFDRLKKSILINCKYIENQLFNLGQVLTFFITSNHMIAVKSS